jgi:pyridoxamine 5'-phosphate oxidase
VDRHPAGGGARAVAGYTARVPDLDPPALPDEPATLDAILAAAWARLGRGADHASEDWHWPVLASVDWRDPERPAADARVVVLRRVDRDACALEIHSDLRAHKLAQLDAAARACLVFHDRESGLQLRAWGASTTHAGDALARRAWERLGATSRRSYLAPRRPGEPVDAPDINQAETLSEDDAGSDRTEPGFANFAAIVLTLGRMEWLRLGRGGHQRARFDWPREGGTPDARWIRP